MGVWVKARNTSNTKYKRQNRSIDIGQQPIDATGQDSRQEANKWWDDKSYDNRSYHKQTIFNEAETLQLKQKEYRHFTLRKGRRNSQMWKKLNNGEKGSLLPLEKKRKKVNKQKRRKKRELDKVSNGGAIKANYTKTF